MVSFVDFKQRLRAEFADRFGQQFESVAKWFLETEPRFASQSERVWLWDDWPGQRCSGDGIDLTIETVENMLVMAKMCAFVDQTLPVTTSTRSEESA